MPYYKPLEELPIAQKQHVIGRLQDLRRLMKGSVPVRTNRSTLLLCTWNIRELSNCDNRCDETYWYIGEIISFFDLVAVQEIGNDLTALYKIMRILGYKYDYIVTDTPNVEGGNERMAFIFNTGKVMFKNIAGEVSLSAKEREQHGLPDGFARPPFTVAFQASWFKFNLCNVHMYFGTDKKDLLTGEKDSARRKKEIHALALKLDERAQKEDVTYILLGDFNIEKKGDPYYEALIGTEDKPTGFFIHPKKDPLLSNNLRSKAYDQIAFNMHNVTLKDLDIDEQNEEAKVGIVDFYDMVFKDEDADYYRPIAAALYEKKGEKIKANWKYSQWRTFQMSDHLPLWMELTIDFTDKYLETLKTGIKK